MNNWTDELIVKNRCNRLFGPEQGCDVSSPNEAESSPLPEGVTIEGLQGFFEVFAQSAHTMSFSIVAPIQATIRGKIHNFNSEEEKFSALVVEWNRLRENAQAVDPFFNDAYAQILTMGWNAVPYLLREVKRKSGHWFAALRWITNANVVTDEMRGDIRAMRAAWLKWGNENDFREPTDEAAGLVQAESAQSKNRRL